MKKSILSFIVGAALSALLAVHLCGTPALTQKDINNESLNGYSVAADRSGIPGVVLPGLQRST